MKRKIKELPALERPYEKCEAYGPSFLSNAELLAVVLRTGTEGRTSVELACDILEVSGAMENLSMLTKASMKDLCLVKGVGKVKAIQIQCIAELSRRIAKASSGDKHFFRSASEVAGYYMEDLRHCDQEKVIVSSFNTKGCLMGDCEISKGTVNQSIVSPRDIFMEAMRCRASHIIILHNHPSGDPTPSPEDRTLTERVCTAGMILGIPVLDHIVIGDQCYYSFRERESDLMTSGHQGI